MKAAKTIEEVIPAAEHVIETIARTTAGSAHDVLKEHLAMPQSELAKMEMDRRRHLSDLGQRVGCEWLDTRLAGGSLLRCLYLEKFERRPLLWLLTWYFNGQTWRATGISVSIDLAALDAMLPPRPPR